MTSFVRLLLKKYENSSGRLTLWVHQHEGKPPRYTIDNSNRLLMDTTDLSQAVEYYERFEKMVKVDE